jgi:predicted acyl esterase
MKGALGGKRMVILLAAILLLVILYFVFFRQDAGYERTSESLIMADGTRLAYDLYLPTEDGVPANGPFPTLFKYTPYNRALTTFDENGHCDFCDFPGTPWYGELMLRGRRAIMGDVSDTVQRTEWVGDVLKSGYAVIVVDRRGTGASFRSWPDIDGSSARVSGPGWKRSTPGCTPTVWAA